MKKRIIISCMLLFLVFSVISCSKSIETSEANETTELVATDSTTPKPTPTPEPLTVIDVVAKDYLALTIMSDGSIQSKGININGSTLVKDLSDIKKIRIIEDTTYGNDGFSYFAITTNGDVYTQFGKLGISAVEDVVFTNGINYKLNDGKYYNWYEWWGAPEENTIYSDAKDIAFSSGNYILKNDGSIEFSTTENGWGKDEYTDITEWTDIIQLDSIHNNGTMIGLKNDGTLLASGRYADFFNNISITNAREFHYTIEPYSGQEKGFFKLLILNNDDTVSLYTNINDLIDIDLSLATDIKKAAINYNGIYCVTNGGELIEYELQSLNETARIKEVENIESLIAKGNIIFALKSDGTIELAMDMITKGRTYTSEGYFSGNTSQGIDMTNLNTYLVVADILNMKDIVDIYLTEDIPLALTKTGEILTFTYPTSRRNMYSYMYNVDALNVSAKALIGSNGSTYNGDGYVSAIITTEGKFLPIDYDNSGGIYNELIRAKVLELENIDKLFSLGSDSYYCIKEDGSTVFTEEPFYINEYKPVYGFTCKIGNRYTDVILTSSGKVLSWKTPDSDIFGEKDFGKSSKAIEIARIGSSGYVVLFEDGTVYATEPYNTMVASWKNVENIYDSNGYVCALTADGKVLTTFVDENWEN